MRTFSAGRDAARRYFTDARRTHVQRIVLYISLWWTSNGLIGYWIEPSFSLHPMAMRTVHLLFVPITINAWHALFHFLTGLAGLLLVRRQTNATIYAFIFAALYEAVGITGVLNGRHVFGMMAVDRFGSWVHITEGIIVFSGGLLAVTEFRLRRQSTTAISTADLSI